MSASAGKTPLRWPAEDGFRMPAEWEPHQATWISWPHKRDSWPGKFESVEPVMVQAVLALCRSEAVRINVLDAAHEQHVRALLDAAGISGTVQFHHFPTNDAWCRDHGAIFVVRAAGRGPQLAAVNCEFNAWGGKYPPFDLDNAIPGRMAAELGVPVYHAGMVLEGGSIDVNGDGTLLTTEQCLLNTNRNPRLDKDEIQFRLEQLFGVRRVIWLGDGIVGDDTDGHVDDLTRFVAADTVITMVEPDTTDINHLALHDNRIRLQSARLADGRPLKVVEISMPEPVEYEGQRLPASYANFLIGNSVVLMPAFGGARDTEAAATLQQCFPDRPVVPIDCRDLVWGLGTFHCLTQQVPEPA